MRLMLLENGTQSVVFHHMLSMVLIQISRLAVLHRSSVQARCVSFNSDHIFQDYLSSMLDCPPTCSCSPTEIYCNKSDNGKFFPLLALQDTGNNGNNSNNIQDLFKNITSM
ncbi:hypothetical protein SKAU_G00311800 [Synaphobranchus kaupii]|uniref:LRRNT domain-containing protein n=1 Tax=Synaphobranchus kaupii TaxID=118154 RepID=A0A9Q1ERS8_SYNKA|nr:hypothetical protein SKAU_G00311800 [Synaphobranchus kaupii]